MKKLTIGDAASGARMISRAAWMHWDEDQHGSGIPGIRDMQLKPTKGYEKVRLVYPQYVCGRQGEAQFVHLPSFPSRLRWRALTAKVSEV